jgi:hypothetical protein
LITEIGFPALDAASKDAAEMTIKFAPEFTRMLTGPSKKIALSNDAAKQKKWLPSNFRLEIPGVNCTRVSRIDAITIKQTVGAQRGGIRGGANDEVTTLTATVEASHSADFSNWMKSTSQSPNSTGNKKPGQLDFLSSDGREAFFSLRFPSLSIRRLTPANSGIGLNAVNLVKVEMYYQGVQFHYTAV